MTTSDALSRPPRRRGIDRKVLAAGVLVGAAAGAVAGRRARPSSSESAGPAPAMIDWERARQIAVSMNRGLSLTETERARLDDYYRGLVEECVPIVSRYTGVTLPDGPERTYVVDRVDWINANISSFQQMFAPLEVLNPNRAGASVAGAMWGGMNRAVLSTEIGLLLGYLARRVLGQYDLSLLGREPVETGKLYYVEPNIRMIERTLGMPKAEFRMWLALHETTHAFEFEGVPWLRPYFNGMIEAYFEFLKQDAEQLRQGWKAMKVMFGRARSQHNEEISWIEAVMTPDQRALFNRMQAAMCMVEGYSNHVMNAVGKDLLANYERIARKFEQRQRDRSPAERLFIRLTGLEMKLEQYRLGERFINTIVEQRGHDVARRIWDGPDSLPTMKEIKEPSLWLARVVDRPSAAD